MSYSHVKHDVSALPDYETTLKLAQQVFEDTSQVCLSLTLMSHVTCHTSQVCLSLTLMSQLHNLPVLPSYSL